MKTIILFFFVTSGIALSQDFQIIVPAEVQIMLTSSDGRRVGYSSALDSVLKEIPRSGYAYGSIGSDEDDGSGPDDYYELYVDSKLTGKVTLEVSGMYTARYFIDITMGVLNRVSISKSSYIMKGGREQFHLEIGNDSISITKTLDRTLSKDLLIAFQLKELGGRPLYVDLANRAEKYEEWLQKADTTKGFQELEKLGKKLDEVYEKSKGPSKDPNHFLKIEAYRILKEDVELILLQTGVRY
jgi:hypothetical protein